MTFPRPALIFDMDGVIVDSNPTHTEAWRLYLNRNGLAFSPAEIERRMLGKHNAEIVQDFFAGQLLTPESISEHGASKERLYRGLMAPVFNTRLVPGIGDFLERHADLPKALATNAEPANVDFVLERASIRQHFMAIVNGQEVARPKPSPDVYLRAAQLLGVNPADCVVFEDSFTGVQAGRAAGMRVVGITTTVRHLDGVDFLAPHFQSPELDVWLAAQRT